jgi:aminobenzoyl-glutamate utilization protein B
MASEALALTAVELMGAPSVLAEAKAELRGRRAGMAISPPPLGAYRTMTTAPESFWDATWVES